MLMIQYWDTTPPAPDIVRAFAAWDAVPGIDRIVRFDKPAARQFLATHFSERQVRAFDRCGPAAMASDYFRYHAVAHLGGLYVDAGWAPAQNETSTLDRVAPAAGGGVLFGFSAQSVPDPLLLRLEALGIRLFFNGFFWFDRPHAPWLDLLCDLTTRCIEDEVSESIGYVTGIGLLVFLGNVARSPDADTYLALWRDAAADDAELRAVLGHYAGFMTEVGFDTLASAARDLVIAPGGSAKRCFQRIDVRSERPTHWSRHAGSIFHPPSSA